MKPNTHKPFPLAFFEGHVVPVSQAQVSVMSKGLQYGMAWFGGIRGYMSDDKKAINLFRLEDHIKRFEQSGRILNVTLPYSQSQIKDIVVDLVKKNQPDTDIYIRPFAYANSTELSPNFIHNPEFAFALYMLPLGDYLPTDTGNSVCVSSWRRPSDNAIPVRAKLSGAYINSALAKQDAVKNGFTEAIELNEAGEVTEGTAMNIFIARNGTLITPPVSSDVLEGITRASVIEIAQNINIPVLERPVDRSELYIADEAFFCGTGAQIAWISHIDHRTIGEGTMGPITNTVKKVFFEAARGKIELYKKWLTQVAI